MVVSSSPWVWVSSCVDLPSQRTYPLAPLLCIVSKLCRLSRSIFFCFLVKVDSYLNPIELTNIFSLLIINALFPPILLFLDLFQPIILYSHRFLVLMTPSITILPSIYNFPLQNYLISVESLLIFTEIDCHGKLFCFMCFSKHSIEPKMDLFMIYPLLLIAGPADPPIV